MSKLRVSSFSVSIDGYGAGPDQSLDNPLGVGGMALHEWAFATRTFRKMFGQDGGVLTCLAVATVGCYLRLGDRCGDPFAFAAASERRGDNVVCPGALPGTRRPSTKTSSSRSTLFCQPGWSCM